MCVFVCVCDGAKVREKREPRRAGAGPLRKPTASFKTARGASGVSYIKKRSVAEKQHEANRILRLLNGC